MVISNSYTASHCFHITKNWSNKVKRTFRVGLIESYTMLLNAITGTLEESTASVSRAEHYDGDGGNTFICTNALPLYRATTLYTRLLNSVYSLQYQLKISNKDMLLLIQEHTSL
jgi:hypothetical protein